MRIAEIIFIVILVIVEPGLVSSKETDTITKAAPQEGYIDFRYFTGLVQVYVHLGDEKVKRQARFLGITDDCVSVKLKDTIDIFQKKCMANLKKKESENGAVNGKSAFIVLVRTLDEQFDEFKNLAGGCTKTLNKLIEIRKSAPIPFLAFICVPLREDLPRKIIKNLEKTKNYAKAEMIVLVDEFPLENRSIPHFDGHDDVNTKP